MTVSVTRSIPPLAALCLALLAACTTPPASTAAAPACDAATSAAAGNFMQQLLTLEADGQRMRELLGRDKGDRFYAAIGYDATQEPGWDTIAVRNGFRIEQVSCAGADAAAREVRVSFPAGLSFDREASGSLPATQQTYSVRRGDKGFLVTSRLPAPFVSTDGALGLLGTRPFDTPPLLAFKNQLAASKPQR